MSDDSLLQAKAREAIQAGTLPGRAPDKLWGGPATGARCAVCGATTSPGEVELEFEFPPGFKTGRTKHHAHARCFSIYTREVAELLSRAVHASALHTAVSTEGKVDNRS